MPRFFGTHGTTITRDGRGYQWLRAGLVISSLPTPPVSQYLFVRQQQPNHLQAFVRSGVPPLPTAPAGRRTIYVYQQQPQPHPHPNVLFGVIAPLPVPGPSVLFVRQEYPLNHPRPYLLRGVAIADVAVSEGWAFAYTVQ